MNPLRVKLNAGEKICGTLVSLTDPCLCEIMGNIGYDCVWIDMEHTYMSYKEVLCHLNASKASGIPAVIRLPQNDLTATKKILEMGPDGIIFPMVTSAAQLKELIEMTLYPPYGTRGFGPMRAIGYGANSAKEYVTEKSLEICRFVQIEHIDFIEDLEEVLKIPYVDGFIFGPNDLSASLGEFLDVFEETTFSKIKEVTAELKKRGKIVGLAGGMSEREIRNWSRLDLDMLFCGADWCYVYDRGNTTLQLMKEHYLQSEE